VELFYAAWKYINCGRNIDAMEEKMEWTCSMQSLKVKLF
jgi:hypothetical protein